MRWQADALYLDLRKALIPFLEGRTHFVHYQGNLSATLPVLSGVPQRSVLGPLLFLIDIPASIRSMQMAPASRTCHHIET